MSQMQFDFEDLEVLQKPAMKREVDGFVFDLMDVITSPLITYSTSWADCIPESLKIDVCMAKMISALKKEYTASIPEVVAYMMTRTLEAPMQREWVNIYCYCTTIYAKEWMKKKLPKDVAVNEIDEYEQSLLKRLRDWIYEKRRQYVKDKLKTQRHEKPEKQSTADRQLSI